jgi:glyoxylase-like metal-dependent hydrolase (beta-lactamase superfamily II)
MQPLLLRANNASTWTGPTGNNTYLLKGQVPTLIDAGVGDSAHLQAIDAALDGAPLAAILLTHGHADHVQGVPALLARWPSAAVVRHSGVELFSTPAGDRQVRAIHTPGHAPDHLCFFDEDSRDLYCGDLVRAGGTIVIPASKGGDLRQYLTSLERIRDLNPRRLLPGHGPIIDDPLRVIAEYVEHRAHRERQVIAALRGGARSAQEIAREIYGPLAADLVAASVDSVMAHLLKLQEEGRVTQAATPLGATEPQPIASPLSAWHLV